MAVTETIDIHEDRFAAMRAEAEARAARKAKHEAARGYVKHVSGVLRKFGNCAIVLMAGTSDERLMAGLEAEFGEEHVHTLKAEGSVQGDAISPQGAGHVSGNLANLGSDDVILLKGVNYREGSGSGTPLVAERLIGVIREHAHRGRRDETQPMMLLVGDGDVADLPTSGKLNHAAQADIAADVFVRFGIYGDNQPATFVDMPATTSTPVFY